MLNLRCEWVQMITECYSVKELTELRNIILEWVDMKFNHFTSSFPVSRRRTFGFVTFSKVSILETVLANGLRSRWRFRRIRVYRRRMWSYYENKHVISHFPTLKNLHSNYGCITIKPKKHNKEFFHYWLCMYFCTTSSNHKPWTFHRQQHPVRFII